MVTYYRHDGGYIAVTDQSPAGFEGIVFVGRGGPIDNISEQLFTSDVLTDPVDVNDVPPSWCTALGYDKVEDFPLLDEEGENLVAEIPVRTPIQRPKQRKEKYVEPPGDTRGPVEHILFGTKDRDRQIGYLVGLVVLLLIFMW